MTKRLHHVLCLTVAALIGALTSCSGQDPESPSKESSAITPSVDQGPGGTESTQDVVNAEVAAGGIQTTYQAYFTGEQLVRISEARTSATGETARGGYEFHGARLLRYIGQSLTRSAPLELEFDLQGRVTLARAGAQDASAEEISEIRDRAQLLRSHALAQRASRMHGMSKTVDGQKRPLTVGR